MSTEGFKIHLPEHFDICHNDTVLVSCYMHPNGEYVGEVQEIDEYMGAYTDKMLWFDSDVRNWLRDRTVPETRPADHMAITLKHLGMEKWNLEELIVLTRGTRMVDRYWVRFDDKEKCKDFLLQDNTDKLMRLVPVDEAKGVYKIIDTNGNEFSPL